MISVCIVVSMVTTVQAAWWDKFGKPKYGGTILVRTRISQAGQFDPFEMMAGVRGRSVYEGLFTFDYTVDPSVHKFVGEYVEPEYYTGVLAEDWEQTDPLTVIVHLRQGIKWHNKPPVNGREFTSDDVVYTYDRVMGTGNGFTKPNFFVAGTLSNIEKVSAVDKYTVAFKLKKANQLALDQVLGGGMDYGQSLLIMSREIGEQAIWDDWNYAIGTGPWILAKNPDMSTEVFTRNPDYYLNDTRYPENQLPYADGIKYISIPDSSTSLAALRTGKVDLWVGQRGGPTLVAASALKKSNPEMNIGMWPVDGYSIDFRNDREPFTDIKVRKALQMAIDRDAIARTHYLGQIDGTPCSLIHPVNSEFITPFDQWPSDLQEEYAYNPERAKELLAEAGFPDGFKTNCLVSTSDDVELLEIIKSYFSQIKVEMDIQTMEMPVFMSYCRDGKMDQMALFLVCGMAWSPVEDIAFRTKYEFRNFSKNQDPVFDKMYDDILAASDMTEYKKLMRKADLYAASQHWAVNVLPGVAPQIWQPWVKGYNNERVMEPGIQYVRMWLDK